MLTEVNINGIIHKIDNREACMAQEIVKLETMSDDEIMALTGQTQGQRQGDFLPQIRIATDDVDDKDRPVPRGSFFINDPETSERVYNTEVQFRPYLNRFKYQVWDNKVQRYTNQTILFSSFQDEIFDELGGMKCGKIPNSKKEGLSPAEQELQKNIKCVRIMFGTVSYTGKTADGKDVTISNLPCIWKSGGQSFMPVNDELEKLTKQQKQMFNYEMVLKTKRERSGGNTFFVVEPKIDISKSELEFTAEDMKLLKMFVGLVAQENEHIYNKWKSVRRHTVPEVIDAEVSVSEFNEETGDEVPW